MMKTAAIEAYEKQPGRFMFNHKQMEKVLCVLRKWVDKGRFFDAISNTTQQLKGAANLGMREIDTVVHAIQNF